MKQKGFTLIELMIALSIMAVLGTVGIAGFRNYSQIQVLQSAVNDFASVLNTARSRALSQVKPPDICGSADTLDGYGVKISATSENSYSLILVCSGLNESIDKAKTFPKGISFADADNGKFFFFPTVTGGAQTTPMQVTISGYGKGKIVSVNSLGGVSAEPLPTPSPTPTPVPTSTPTPTVTPIPMKRVFITSANYNGNLGGLSGADGKCQQLANSKSFGGIWKAWLSSSETAAGDRLTHAGIAYRLVDGITIIANNWNDLVDGVIINPINKDENGSAKTSYVWTTTNADGTTSFPDFPNEYCNDWNSSLNSLGGRFGWSGSTNAQWTFHVGDGNACGASGLPLYCFEQ